MTGTITELEVSVLGWRHTFPDDVDIMLVGPTGAATLLVSDAGGNVPITSANVLFDDGAPGSLPNGGTITSGSFRPTNFDGTTSDGFPAPAPAPPASVSLTNFDGTDPNGTWSLYVIDDTGSGPDVGQLAGGFQLFITTTTMGPTQFNAPTLVRIHDRWGFGTPNPSTITVSGAGDTIVTVAVTLHGVTHPNPDDLEFLLVGPTGAAFSFASDAGGGNAITDVTFTLDDDAAIALPDTAAIMNNTSYRPTNYVTGDTFRVLALPPYAEAAPAGSITFATQFTGTNPNGTWSLYVSDDQNNNPGSITGGWSLDFVLTPVELMEFRVE
jgi:subtilisin-like proprotein convertase family protein